TIMVVTAGAEKFEDRNGNGQWDDGEPFDDLPEPFLDTNDNGEYDVGEPFFDSDNNGEYSEADGVYNAETFIRAIYKVVWTGKPEENETAAWITHSPTTTLIPDGGSMTVTARLVDKNMNPVAVSATSGDALTFLEVNGALNATQPASSPGYFYLDTMEAWSLDPTTWDFLAFDETAADFTCKFDDASPDPEGTPVPYTIGIDASLSPGPEGEYGDFNPYSFSFMTTVSGTVQ
ncbi:hypothetical protein KJ865_14775, partial [Myxococcota bacterium]|nr:hypothetical protein [Myxococcota bacterium]